jgi:hypothetical protein
MRWAAMSIRFSMLNPCIDPIGSDRSLAESGRLLLAAWLADTCQAAIR